MKCNLVVYMSQITQNAINLELYCRHCIHDTWQRKKIINFKLGRKIRKRNVYRRQLPHSLDHPVDYLWNNFFSGFCRAFSQLWYLICSQAHNPASYAGLFLSLSGLISLWSLEAFKSRTIPRKFRAKFPGFSRILISYLTCTGSEDARKLLARGFTKNILAVTPPS